MSPRALLAPVRLALRRSLAHPGRWALIAVGVTVGIGAIGGLLAAGTVGGDRASRQLLARLSPQQRTLRLAYNGRIDAAQRRAATATLARLTPSPPTAAALFQPTHIGRQLVRLTAVAPLSRWVALEHGRLPRGACTAARCEVLSVGGGRTVATLAARGVNLRIVGSGRLTSAVPLGFAGAGARDPSLLVSADPTGLEDLTGLSGVYRTLTWSAPLEITRLRAWGLAGSAGRLADADRRLQAAGSPFTLDAPFGALESARARAGLVRRRVTLAGSAAAVALAAFLLLAAASLRRDLAAERFRLVRQGATLPQRALLAITECGAPVLAGTVAGVGAAVVVAALEASAAGVPSGAILDHALLTGTAVRLLAGAFVAALALLLAGCLLSDRAARRVTELLAAAAVAVLAAGGLGALTLVAVVTLAGALVVARLTPPLLRAAARVTPARRPGARTALIGLARATGPAALTAAALAGALGLAGFATAYRSTLLRGERDQARYAVPLAATVRPGPSLAPPLATTPPQTWAKQPGVRAVVPVIRASAQVVEGPSLAPATLLGVPAAALLEARVPATGVRALRAPADPLRGASVLAPGAERLSVRARVMGDAVDLSAVLAFADGRSTEVPLGQTGARTATLHGTVPAAASGARLVGIVARLQSGELATTGHQEAESVDGAAVPASVLTLGPLLADGRPLATFGAWRGSGAVTGVRTRRAGETSVSLSFDHPGIALIRPPGVAAAPVPVLVDGRTAADAGATRRLDIEEAGVTVSAVVVGTIARVATVPGSGQVVVADEGVLAAALGATQPGAGTPDELWLAGDTPQLGALARGFDVQTRDGRHRALAADPLTRGVLGALEALAGVALALALGGLALAAAAGRRDDGGTLHDLEAQGVAPAALRGVLRVRLAALVSIAVVGGAALTAALMPVVVRAAGAGRPTDPPLRADVPAGTLVAGLLVALVAGLVLAMALPSGALREHDPRRPRPLEAGA